jgi:CheY-like chemotaxis protein
MLPRVFEMFTQVDRTLNRSQGGLGIGLTLAKTLVQMHGGRIEAHSAGLGQGSEFIVRLPLVSAAASSPSAASGSSKSIPEKISTTLPPRKILLVDDTHAAAYMLGKLLEMMGHQVRVALGGEEALELLAQEMPEVVISDIGMPKMDGYELAKRIRALPGGAHVTLVALTGFGQDTDKTRAFEAGFNRHLVKPVGFETLESLLKSLPARALSAPATHSAGQ